MFIKIGETLTHILICNIYRFEEKCMIFDRIKRPRTLNEWEYYATEYKRKTICILILILMSMIYPVLWEYNKIFTNLHMKIWKCAHGNQENYRIKSIDSQLFPFDGFGIQYRPFYSSRRSCVYINSTNIKLLSSFRVLFKMKSQSV